MSAGSVPFGEDSFLVVGGSNNLGTYYDSVFQYDAAAESWIVRAEELKMPRQQVENSNLLLIFLEYDFLKTFPSQFAWAWVDREAICNGF